MTGLAYLASIVAVVWLSYWLLQNSRTQPKQSLKRNNTPPWTPFDYELAEKQEAEPVKKNQMKNWRARASDRASDTRRHG